MFVVNSVLLRRGKVDLPPLGDTEIFGVENNRDEHIEGPLPHRGERLARSRHDPSFDLDSCPVWSENIPSGLGCVGGDLSPVASGDDLFGPLAGRRVECPDDPAVMQLDEGASVQCDEFSH